MIIPLGIFDENNINGSKIFLQKKDSQSSRSTNLPTTTTITTLPVNNTIHAHSSSSSLDSAGAKNAILIEKNPLGQINSMTTISSTTTDSDLESEQDEIYTDDNPFADFSNQSPKVNLSHSQKNHEQEQISRRVKHFRKLFQSELADQMPELIDSYVCAYQGMFRRK